MKKKTTFIGYAVFFVAIIAISCSKEPTPGNDLAAGTCPSSITCPSGVACGCYTVSGLGATKSALRSAGASQYFIASAMVQTEGMTTNYSYGDGKTGDSFNAGRTKLNYYEARIAGVGQGSTAAFWNKCLTASGDVKVWNKVKSYWGKNYWAVERNGLAGLSNPNDSEIIFFKTNNDWTNAQLGNHLTDDVRFWVNPNRIPGI